MEKILQLGRKIIPTKVFNTLNPIYHYTLSFCGALLYRFPSRKIKVIAVTGTKGKTTTVEILNAILEEAGYKTALSSTVHFKIGNKSEENLYKMSMPGRFFIQKFLRKSVREGCQYVVMEMTSQGVLKYRHKWVQLDGLIFTNLSPEHIEAHGSYENYILAKLKIAKLLEKSKKERKILVVNRDDEQAQRFLAHKVSEQYTFGIDDAMPYELKKDGLEMSLANNKIQSHLSGLFNIYNILGAITMAKALGISMEVITRAIEKFNGIRGRMEKIDVGQDFNVIVDYAHTADSLEKVYEVFQNSRKICVFGCTGGGRDKWKRQEMGRVAESYCDEIILTNDDPYDEDPISITNDIKEGIESDPTVLIDRREAIKEAIKMARTGDTVLITGKGTDPYIMGPNGSKTPWDDAKVTREELIKHLRGN
jgi:UDP-N-acetylmuramoyl-L-alanyl-D-glutamate--2,6-diaminopimelate ligase